MKFSSLSKTINLFIIGGSVLANYYLLEYFLELKWSNIITFQMAKDTTTIIQVIIVLVAIPALIFLGLIVESLSLFFREIMKSFLNDKPHVINFLIKKTPIQRMFNHYVYWKNKHIEFLKNREESFYNEITSPHIKGLGAQMLFDEAPQHLIEWVVKHHATYLLASNYVVLFYLNIPFVFFFPITIFYKFIVFFGMCIIIYLLAILALDKYFYSYTLVYRFSARKIGLNGEKKNRDDTNNSLSSEDDNILSQNDVLELD